MKSWLNRLKLKLFLATQTLPYTLDYTEMVYQIYLNHKKVIHYRDGYPVYSLSTPALFSKPAAHFFARLQFRVIQNRNTPNLMSFAINDVCNAACRHCSFFDGVDDKNRKPMTVKQCQDAIRQAQEIGVSIINFVGGEPLMRSDFDQILHSVNKDLSTTVVFTNGWNLSKRIGSLKKAGLDSVYISLDASTADKHDDIRGKKGLFDRAVEGILKAKSLGMSVGISVCITPESFKQGEFEKMVELGKSIGVHEVLVFDAMPTGRMKDRKDLVDNHDWINEMIERSKSYNQRHDYPGVLLYPYATSHRSVGCSCGTSYFYLSPYGDVMSCDFNHAKFGNILDTELFRLWDSLTSKQEFNTANWGGCKIKNSSFIGKDCIDTGGNCCG